MNQENLLDYYSEPQEYIADVLGKANRMDDNGQPHEYLITPEEAFIYFLFTMIG